MTTEKKLLLEISGKYLLSHLQMRQKILPRYHYVARFNFICGYHE